MDEPEPTKPLAVSIGKACWLLGIGRTTIYQLINTDRLLTTTIGRRRLVIYASLNALLHGGPRR